MPSTKQSSIDLNSRMTPRTANLVLLGFDIFALGCLFLLYVEHSKLISSIEGNTYSILFDTGIYYLILATLFPLIRLIQAYVYFSKAKHYQKTVCIALITWLCFCLAFANLLPRHIKSALNKAGYSYCGDKPSSRLSFGAYEKYRKNCL